MILQWKRVGVMDGDVGDDREMNFDDWNENSRKKDDKDEVDGMK